MKKLALLCLAVSACIEWRPQIEQPKTQISEGLSFRYPGNWSLSSKQNVSGEVPYQITTVESSGNSFCMVIRYAKPIDVEVRQFADNMLSEMSGVYQVAGVSLLHAVDTETKTSQRRMAGQSAEGVTINFNARALGQLVPTLAEVHRLRTADATVLVVTYAPRDDAAKVQPGFDLIYDSMTLSAGAPPAP